MSGPDDDIINLPHHVSTTRPRMSMQDRAAQFSPFAALSGHGDAVAEASRLTDRKIEIDETDQAMLDRKRCILMDAISEHPTITVTYFKKDERKEGGKYVSVCGKLKKIDEYERTLTLMSGEKIAFDDVYDITSDLFRELY